VKTPFTTLTSRAVLLPVDDVDTDQIIPARFLKGTAKVGLGQHLFADWRARPGFPLLQPSAAGAQILLTGNNFGCGSSREHAPWALVDWGFRVIIGRSFADIFKENATKNGLLLVALPEAACIELESALREHPDRTLHVDLASERVSLRDGGSFPFVIDPFAKHCLASGLDELGYILSFTDRITAHEQR
jgi:3-isopropylmalate/(R)-2-methylmalate dehydratase small subunit